jgi:hypothetical protein
LRRELEKLGRESEAPLFIKIGAHDGCTGDPCTEFLLDLAKWHGLLVEPVPAFAEKLEERFGDRERVQPGLKSARQSAATSLF